MNKTIFTLLALAFATQAHAAGYEKSIMWGGKTGSMAGISTSYIEGADALYFNPAGLVAKAPGQQLSFNISPVWSKFSGPYNDNNDVIDSKSGFATPLSLIYSNTLNDQWAFGAGGYISGGSKVDFEDIDINYAGGKPSTKTDLQIAELGVGVGWKPNTTWKFGASYRYVLARASFGFFQRTGTSALNLFLNDLKDQESAFKLGAQWAVCESTHIGLTYRSEVNLNASGSVDGTAYAKGSNNKFAVNHADASVSTVFPQAVTLGADHSFSDVWQGLAEVAWTNYARVDKIQTTMNTTVQTVGTAVVNPAVTQNWQDQWNLRLGGNYMGYAWPIRFGYGLTTQVTNSDWARPTFTPPGTSHTLTVGSGQTFELGGQKLEFNGSGEYTFLSATGNGKAAGDGTPVAGGAGDIRAGDYKTSSYALHLGLAYNF
jgi:long-subunit fatty acid transport protein